MKLTCSLAIGALCVVAQAVVAIPSATADENEQELLKSDRAAFGSGSSSIAQNDSLLDLNFTWTDSSGNTRGKSEIMQDFRSGKVLPTEAGDGRSGSRFILGTISAHAYGQIGLVQIHSGNLYVLHIWANHGTGWRLLLYHAVSTGMPPSTEPGAGVCENPCNTVPFQPQSEDEREVIHAYQAVERAVAAHNSTEWGAHIADDFFAVTSNSDRPLDKATRMAGLDNQKVAGIAPFPLVTARMFEFGDAMVMTSVQQPERGLPLRVTRVWFKRNGAWLEAYSYQTTIRPSISIR